MRQKARNADKIFAENLTGLWTPKRTGKRTQK
jgi:hypothetical protein